MAIEKRLADGEEVVFHTRTHVKTLFVPALVLLVLVVAAGYLTAVVDNGTLRLVVWIVALVAAIVFSVWPFLVWLAATYTVTNRRLTTRRGVITRTGHDIPLTRIADVQLQKGLLDRVLGCGTLLISDASDSPPIVLPDVPAVEQKQLQLSAQLHHRDDDGE